MIEYRANLATFPRTASFRPGHSGLRPFEPSRVLRRPDGRRHRYGRRQRRADVPAANDLRRRDHDLRYGRLAREHPDALGEGQRRRWPTRSGTADLSTRRWILAPVRYGHDHHHRRRYADRDHARHHADVRFGRSDCGDRRDCRHHRRPERSPVSSSSPATVRSSTSRSPIPIRHRHCARPRRRHLQPRHHRALGAVLSRKRECDGNGRRLAQRGRYLHVQRERPDDLRDRGRHA